jgi:hypothetical protein
MKIWLHKNDWRIVSLDFIIVLYLLVNWFRREYGRTESTNSYDDSASPAEGGFIRQPSLHQSYSKSLHKAGSR